MSFLQVVPILVSLGGGEKFQVPKGKDVSHTGMFAVLTLVLPPCLDISQQKRGLKTGEEGGCYFSQLITFAIVVRLA